MSWDSQLESDLRARYATMLTKADQEIPVTDHVEPLANGGFLTEISGKVILTAPAASLSKAGDIPEQMREAWEKASHANPYFQWLQGRFVEAEKANHNGAFWSTEDLQFGEMSVKAGPLNWLHEGRKVVGTIADNALIMPKVEPTTTSTAHLITSTITQPFVGASWTNGGNLQTAAAPRPYMAAVSAVWKWLYPDEAKVIDKASDDHDLYYSMECVSQQMQCVESADSNGCGQAFDYFKAMTDPGSTCQHIAERSATRRMVNPSFLGGAVIVPPTRPGWGEANAEVMRQAAHLAEMAGQNAPADANTSQWELLMGAVLAYAVA